jgi:uncharacterized protein (TIGR04141 family)
MASEFARALLGESYSPNLGAHSISKMTTRISAQGGSMSKSKVRNQSLSIFLIREGVPVAEALKPGLRKVSVSKVGDLYYKQNPRSSPKWLTFFEDTLAEIPRLSNQSNGALLVVRRGKRHFAVSFGLGRHLLEAGKYEDSFGLRVTLNSVDPDRLKSVDRRTFDAISCHTRTQASQAGDVNAFGLNVEQDLLRAATGSPLDEQLGRRMTGMDALLVTVPTTIEALPSLLDKYLIRYEDDSYKKTFPWVDHIGEVRDAKLRAELDEQLVAMIRTSAPSDMSAWLAVPDLIEWAEIGGFRYRSSNEAELYADLHVRDFLDTVADVDVVTAETLRHRHVFAYDTDDERWIRRWTVYSCLYGEIEHDATTYLLSSGVWYRVEREFVATIDRLVARLVRTSTLPIYSDKSEGDYNKRVSAASSGKIALLDRKLIRIGGTTVEFCDLFTSDHRMIHVKRYGGSSVLSHLFAQGSVAANAFLEDPAFRAAVNTKLPKSHQFKDIANRPDPKQFEVNYAIVSRSKKRIDKALPFFSRLNLRNAARQLRAFGFNVVLSKIEAT